MQCYLIFQDVEFRINVCLILSHYVLSLSSHCALSVYLILLCPLTVP